MVTCAGWFLDARMSGRKTGLLGGSIFGRRYAGGLCVLVRASCITVCSSRTLMPNSHRPPDATRQCCLCRVRRCELSRPDRRTNVFCVGVRPAVALRRPTHSDAERTCLADSIHTATPDTTRRSCGLTKIAGVDFAGVDNDGIIDV